MSFLKCLTVSPLWWWLHLHTWDEHCDGQNRLNTHFVRQRNTGLNNQCDGDCQYHQSIWLIEALQLGSANDGAFLIWSGGDFTARIRRMGEGTVFSLFVSSHLDPGGGGVPQPGLDVGGGYPSQVWVVGGVPQPGLDGGGGVPQSGLDGGEGGYPSQVWMVEGSTPARSWWGGTLARSWWLGGYPGQVLMVGVVPRPGLDGGGYPRYPLARSGWWGVPGVPPYHVWMGYPLTGWGTPMTGWSTPPTPPAMTGWGTPPTSIASTCYAAGGMPLAFTQEDFLFASVFSHDMRGTEVFIVNWLT